MKHRTNHIGRQTGPVGFYKKTICRLKYYRFVIGYYINYIPPRKCAKKPHNFGMALKSTEELITVEPPYNLKGQVTGTIRWL